MVGKISAALSFKISAARRQTDRYVTAGSLARRFLSHPVCRERVTARNRVLRLAVPLSHPQPPHTLSLTKTLTGGNQKGRRVAFVSVCRVRVYYLPQLFLFSESTLHIYTQDYPTVGD